MELLNFVFGLLMPCHVNSFRSVSTYLLRFGTHCQPVNISVAIRFRVQKMIDKNSKAMLYTWEWKIASVDELFNKKY